jgi:HEAT repeat protein
MEILAYSFYPFALNLALALSAICFVLLFAITCARWQIYRRQKHTSTFDQAIGPIVKSYLEGHTTVETVIEAMQKEPSEALSLLMKHSLKMEPTMRSRLQPLFAGLLLVDAEIAALESHNVKRRLLASERLGHLNESETSTKALLNALDDEIPAIRLSAARSLAAHGKTEAIESILLALDLPGELAELRVVEAIFDYGSSAVPTLVTVLENTKGTYSDNSIIVAIHVLGMLHTTEALQPLITQLNNPEFRVRLNAARALGEIGDPEAISPLVALGDDSAWEVRSKVVKSIGELHADRQIPMLSNALSDTSWSVRSSAAQALHSLGQPGITELQDVMKNTKDSNTREMCSQVLEEHNVLDTKKV